MPGSAAILDVDGTLVDSNYQHALSWYRAFRRFDITLPVWRLHRHVRLTFADLARWANPVVRGWMQYYGAFYRSELSGLLARINTYLVRWIRKKYKRLRSKKSYCILII